jgi:hypothetical protein
MNMKQQFQLNTAESWIINKDLILTCLSELVMNFILNMLEKQPLVIEKVAQIM